MHQKSQTAHRKAGSAAIPTPGGASSGTSPAPAAEAFVKLHTEYEFTHTRLLVTSSLLWTGRGTPVTARGLSCLQPEPKSYFFSSFWIFFILFYFFFQTWACKISTESYVRPCSSQPYVCGIGVMVRKCMQGPLQSSSPAFCSQKDQP